MGFNLIAKLGMDGSGFKLGIKEAESISAKFAKDFSRTMQSSLVGWFGGGWLANKLTGLFSEFVEGAKGIKEFSAATQVSTERAIVWDGVSKKLGISLENLAGIFGKVKAAQDAAFNDSTSPAGKAFAALGISERDIAASSGEEMFTMLLQRFKSLGADQAGSSMRQIVGENWSRLAPAAGYDFEQIKASQPGADTVELANDLNKAYRGIKTSVFPALKGAMDWLGAAALSLTGGSFSRNSDLIGPDIQTGASKRLDEAKANREKDSAYDKMIKDRDKARDRDLELEYDVLHRQEERTARRREGALIAGVMNRSDMSGLEKQGIFLRGAPTESNNIPKQQLEASKTVIKKMDTIISKMAMEYYVP